jgi:hypothetical protein
MPSLESPTKPNIAAALRHVLNQLLRALEEPDPSFLLKDGGALPNALDGWRKTLAGLAAEPTLERARRLEEDKLVLMGKVAVLEKECADLRARNGELLEKLVKLNQREDQTKKQILDAQFSANGFKAEAKRLDLEVRDLRRQLRTLEGGPPLTPAEAAPHSIQAPVEKSRSPKPKQPAGKKKASTAKKAARKKTPARRLSAKKPPAKKPTAKKPPTRASRP